MSCSPFHLRDYHFRELPESSSREVELHLKGCQTCREELERLRATEAALLSMRDEEIPQRIAFVSDKVFEPSPLRRWFGAFWNSAARLGFASAAMLSVALLVSVLSRPAPAPPPPRVDLARFEAEMKTHIDTAIRTAVAEAEARQSRKTSDLLAAADKKNEIDRRAVMLAVAENLDVMRKHLNRMILASNSYGESR
jgi:hypothetical protein